MTSRFFMLKLKYNIISIFNIIINGFAQLKTNIYFCKNRKMNLNDELIEKAAKQHALEVLGEEQYNDPEMQVPKESIMEDFKAGVEWSINNLTDKK